MNSADGVLSLRRITTLRLASDGVERAQHAPRQPPGIQRRAEARDEDGDEHGGERRHSPPQQDRRRPQRHRQRAQADAAPVAESFRPAHTASRWRLSSAELTITDNDDSAIAAAAIIGLRKPNAAIGMPMLL